MTDTFLQLVNGKTTRTTPVVVSNGAADAGRLAALGIDGKFDDSVLPAVGNTNTYLDDSTERDNGLNHAPGDLVYTGDRKLFMAADGLIFGQSPNLNIDVALVIGTGDGNQYIIAAKQSSAFGLKFSNNSGVSYSDVSALAGKHIVACDYSSQSTATVLTADREVWISTNPSSSWTLAGTLGSGTVSAGLFKTVTMSGGGEKQAILVNGQLFVSADSGENWTDLGSGYNFSAIRYTTGGDYLYACATGGRIHVSTDDGAHWTPGGPSSLTVHDFTTLDSSVTYASAMGGIYVTTNNGGTWSLVAGTSGSDWYGIVCVGSFVAAGNGTGEVWYSNDGWTTKEMIDSGWSTPLNFMVMTDDYTGILFTYSTISSMKVCLSWIPVTT